MIDWSEQNRAFDEWESNSRLANPDERQAEVRRLVDAELEKLGVRAPLRPQATLTSEQEALRARVFKVAESFLKRHPEFVPSPENEARLFEYMEVTGTSFDKLEGFEKAYADLKSELDLEIPKPARAVRAHPKVTREQVEKMSVDEMGRRMMDPGFAAEVERLLSRGGK